MSDLRRIEELLWSVKDRIEYLEAKNQKRHDDIKEKIFNFKMIVISGFAGFCIAKFFSGPETDRQEFYSTLLILAVIAILLSVVYFSYKTIKFLLNKLRNFLSE